MKFPLTPLYKLVAVLCRESLLTATTRMIPLILFTGLLSSNGARASSVFERPPAGWNSWAAFDKNVSEASILRNAEALVRTGLAAAGYRFVNVDDAWAGPRMPDGTATSDNVTFPSGIPVLAAQIHDMNLSFGIYTDRGARTCGGRPASYQHEKLDARTFAHWGVDYIKEDSCGATHEHDGAFAEYGKFQAAINATGRPMFFSLCGWMRYYAAAGRHGIGQSWRVGADCNSWDDFMLNVDAAAATARFAGPGAFNDVDEIGRAACDNFNGNRTSGFIGCDYNKMVTQFSLIAVVGSPLLLSYDMSNWTRPWSGPPGSVDLVTLYSNPEVLAVHQALDAAGKLTYSRLVGGPITAGGVVPGTTKLCNTTDREQLWSLSDTGRIYSRSPGIEGWCLRQGPMGNPKPAGPQQCGHAEVVWVSPCNTSCCGTNCEEYAWQSIDGTLRSGLKANVDPGGGGDPGTTLTVAPEGVPDTVMAEEQFNHTDPRASTQQVELGSDGLLRVGKTGYCLSAVAPSNSSVFGRKLLDGWAVQLINWAEKEQLVECNSVCMARMGFGAGANVTLRDLWAHTDNGTVTELSCLVAGGGASKLVKLTAAKLTKPTVYV